jgi:hypothetical protein
MRQGFARGASPGLLGAHFPHRLDPSRLALGPHRVLDPDSAERERGADLAVVGHLADEGVTGESGDRFGFRLAAELPFHQPGAGRIQIRGRQHGAVRGQGIQGRRAQALGILIQERPARYESTFSASWGLAPDSGSPITQVRYWITDATGNVVVPERIVSAVNPTGIPAISGPSAPGEYRLNVELADEVGFVGPAASVAIPHDTTPPAAPQDISVTPPSAARSARGFDVAWSNIVDDGAPINAAHYEITDAAGNVVVGEQTVSGENPQAIEHLATPRQRGSYRLLVWLSDAEGNVGAPVSAPLAYDCVRSEVKGASSLSATFGPEQRNQVLVAYGSGATIAGHLRGAAGHEIAGAPVCVYSRIVTSKARRFLGVAVTDDQGAYQYPVAAGASRELVVENRPGQRTIRSAATLVTRAHPSMRLVSKTPIHNKTTAFFRGRLPGPDSGSVAIVLQIKDGNGWTVFGRATTRADGSYSVKYKFTQTFTPVTFTVRTQMPPQKGVPYHSGSSELIPVPVRPGHSHHAEASSYRAGPAEPIAAGPDLAERVARSGSSFELSAAGR